MSVKCPVPGRRGYYKMEEILLTNWPAERKDSMWLFLAFVSVLLCQTSSYASSGDPLYIEASNIGYNVIGTVYPVVDIKANGSNGPVVVAQGAAVSIDVSLDPGPRQGQWADWYASARSPFGDYWYTSNGWVRSNDDIKAYEGGLVKVVSYNILDTTTLPVGSYTFYFWVDVDTGNRCNDDNCGCDGDHHGQDDGSDDNCGGDHHDDSSSQTYWDSVAVSVR
ncbi:MAG: hypothetical protein HY880_06145 [Deltaproteobacteria bacterium]|nr:hypothetical protein [Deltaproteobacteria bacterium]